MSGEKPNEDMSHHLSKPPCVGRDQATKLKGYPHPGSYIKLPDQGGVIHFQFGHPQEVGRNGAYAIDVIEALVQHFLVYQEPGAAMPCKHTAACVESLERAKAALAARKADREARGVLNTDKP